MRINYNARVNDNNVKRIFRLKVFCIYLIKKEYITDFKRVKKYHVSILLSHGKIHATRIFVKRLKYECNCVRPEKKINF